MKFIYIDGDCPALKRLVGFYVANVMPESARGYNLAFRSWLARHLDLIQVNRFYVGSDQKHHGYQFIVDSDLDWTRVSIEYGPFSECDYLESELNFFRPDGKIG